MQKADDIDYKNERLFKQNQDLSVEVEVKTQENVRRQREVDDLREQLAQARISIEAEHKKAENFRHETDDLRKIREDFKNKVSEDGANERAEVEETYLRQINNFKK